MRCSAKATASCWPRIGTFDYRPLPRGIRRVLPGPHRAVLDRVVERPLEDDPAPSPSNQE
jgi:hypothetical protein